MQTNGLSTSPKKYTVESVTTQGHVFEFQEVIGSAQSYEAHMITIV